ncbi:MAG: hypothetical protein H6627_08310 [Calditrichae bacterium]|nr:hypothetical protein [Calditrichota bacterium]MCB9058554.1 hypothetical protein [Calditrichia bacterium]
MIYQILVILVIVFFIILILQKRNSEKTGFREFSRNFLKEMIDQIKSFKEISKTNNGFGFLKKSVFSLAVLMFFILVLSSMLPVISGNAMSGLFLILHLLAAPVFVICVTVFVVLKAHDFQFSNAELKYLLDKMNSNVSKEKVKEPESFRLKVYFWIFVLFVITAILSVLLSMYPIFGTNGQITLLDIHRYSVLVLLSVFGFALVNKFAQKN